MTPVPFPGPLHAVKRRAVRDTIWVAAMELFDAQGYQATTVEQIAEKAGLSRRTFFRYFSSKDEIVFLSMETFADLVAKAIRDSATVERPLELVRGAVMRVAEHVAADPHARLAIRIADENPEVKAAQLSRLHLVRSRIAVELCRVLGVRDPHHPHITALAGTTVMLIETTIHTWYRDAKTPIERTVNALVDAIAQFGEKRSSAAGRRRRSGSRAGPAPSRSDSWRRT